MKKSLIFVGMLAIAYANAQEGNVGINTDNPKATLEVKVAGINSNNDTNQGVLIPKLTKTRVAGIADSKLVKGTLVFVEGSTYTGANAKVVDINADGFYYYNGTKWVKVEGYALPNGTANGQVLKWNGSAWIVGTDADTKYTAGNGLTLTGTQFSLPISSTGTGDVVTGITQTANGITVTKGNIVDTNTTYTAGTGLTLTGTTFSANPAGIALGGDVTGNANANTVAKIQGRAVANTAPTNGQVLKWNQAEGVWKPENDANTNTTYTAGTGLALTGTAFSVKYGNEAGTAVQGNDSRVNNGQTAFSWGNHANAGYLKTLPIASATQLGGVKVGSNLSITADGVLSATDTNTTYTAGNGITISGSNNAIAVNPAGIALGGDVTGNANANTVAKIQGRAVANTAPTNGQVLKWNQAEGVWKPENDANTNTTYTAGTGLALTGTAFSVKYGNEAGTAVQGNDSRVNNGQTAFSWGNHATAGYLKTLPIASATQLGGVKVGANLNITADGVLSATDTNTTYTAGTGLTLTGTTFSANPAGIALGGDVTGNANANKVTKIQGREVADTVPTAGQILEFVNGKWTPTNKPVDTNTTYAGSASVVLSGNSFQRAALTGDVSSAQNSNTVTINTGAVTGAKIANGTITADKLAPGVIPTIPAEVDGIVGNEVTNATANKGLIRAGEGTNASPYTLGVADNGITNAMIANNAINSAKIQDGTITGADIANATITANKLAAGVIPTDTNTNIYTNDGTLSANRTVNMNSKNLLFTGTTDTGGRIGLGTNNPSSALNIVGTGGASDDISIDSYSNTINGHAPTIFLNRYRGNSNTPTTVQVSDHLGGILFKGYTSSGSLKDGATIISSVREVTANEIKANLQIWADRVGIGTITPQTKLEVNGNFAMVRGIGNEQAYIGGDGAANDVQLGSMNPNVTSISLYNTAYDGQMDLNLRNLIQTSDARFKTNISTISNSTSIINGLRGVTYHWNNKMQNKEKLQYGFIAQEVEKVLPDLVNTDEKGYKSVNYIGVIPILVEALQEKDAKIKELETRLERLEKLIK